MIREKRYLVLKQSDIDDALDAGEQLELSSLALKIHIKRIANGKQPFDGVVVESDWPECEPVWKMIEERVYREDANRKFEKMFGDKKSLGYFFAVENPKGKFLITSNAHSTNRLKNYGGYEYRALFSPDCVFGNKEILITDWGTCFTKVIQVSFEELVALYDTNVSISNTNITKFINDKLNDDMHYSL